MKPVCPSFHFIGFSILLMILFIWIKTGAQCNWINPFPQGADIASIQCVTGDIGYAIDYGQGNLLKTCDGGLTWTAFPTGAPGAQSAMYFTSVNTGFITGLSGFILRTDDGGETWNNIPTPASNWLWSIHFPDTQTGYAAGDDGTVIKTTDGGFTWLDMSTGFNESFNRVYFIDSST
jgi:photosystem II stability/assembly factor-like uncharacterized protein